MKKELKKYSVSVWENSYGVVHVEAENEEEALEKAKEAIDAGEASWNSSESGAEEAEEE